LHAPVGVQSTTSTAKERHEEEASSRRALNAVSISLLVIALALLFWYTADVWLLTFAGVLFALFLRSMSVWIARKSGMNHGLALLLVVLGLLALTIAGTALIAPGIDAQASELARQLPQSLDQLLKYLGHIAWLRPVLARYRNPAAIISAPLLSRLGGVFSTTFGLIGAFLLIFFVGLYGAADPDTYRNGILRLIPKGSRERGGEVIDQVIHALQSWLFTRLLAMGIIGATTALGLWALRIPVALGLGVLAAILTFIPYIGPTMSAVPAILIALLKGPMWALYVIILELGIHLIEAYLITPMLQKRAMELAPALAIVTQVIFGAIWGLLGFILATPLTAMAVVLVRMLYVEDTLGDVVPQKSADGED
jgi:predicted PurR-regulated permease PerM